MSEAILEPFLQQHNALNQRLAQTDEPETLVPEMESLIAEGRELARDVPPGAERDALRTFLQYWAGQVYEYSDVGAYPSTELAPFIGTVEPDDPTLLEILKTRLKELGKLEWVLVVLLLLIAGWFGLSSIIRGIWDDSATSPEITVEAGTIVVVVTIEPQPTGTEGPTVTPSLTPSVTPTLPPPTPGPSPTAGAVLTPTITPTPQGVSVQLLTPAEGSEIKSQITLAGTYANLREGYSIHILVQPLSAGGTYYPLPEMYSIPKDLPTGEWVLDINLAAALGDFPPDEQINIIPVIALDTESRTALAGSGTGFDEIPRGVLAFDQFTTVSVGASEQVQETRLVYASFLEEQGNIAIVSTRPDGSDFRQISFNSRLTELYPSLSPDGKQIAFVGRAFNPSGDPIDSLWLMDSNGENARPLEKASGTFIERPLWSPDGRYLAYSAIDSGPSESANVMQIQASELQVWTVFIYDTDTGEVFAATDGQQSYRFPSWMPDSDTLIVSGMVRVSGTIGLYELPLGGEPKVIFDTNAEETHPAVSPDGERIAFVQYSADDTEGNRDIFVFNRTDYTFSALGSDPSLDQFPAWSADGNTIFFQSYRAGQPNIWVVNLNGKNPLQITFGKSDGRPFVGFMDTFLPGE